MPDVQQIVADNLARVRERIAKAAARAGRSPSEIRLVAVTKYAGVEVARALASAGCTELGESRPQELWEKAAALHDLPVAWHLIGHLQRNKVKRTLPYVALIHAVDSERLLTEIEAEAAKIARPVNVLLEVNVSGDAAKHGFAPAEVEAVLAEAAELRFARIRGLMTMAALEGGPERARCDFAGLRSLRDKLRGAVPAGVTLDELSMGMSGDFEEAILEGATLVRVGSALVEGVV